MNTAQSVIPLIKEAGSILLSYRQSSYETNTKNHAEDFVTTADKESDAYIRKELQKLFPGDTILSEENSYRPENYTGRVWMIDPLDGTKAFIGGSESFSIMIGLAVNGVPTLGVTYAPAVDKLYWAEKGSGAYLETKGKEQQLKVSTISTLKEARLIDRRRTGSA